METFIDPRTLARIKDMPLIAKTVAEGFLHGSQQSQQRGIGLEFSQYRSYEPGDELNRIDWKLFARSDRYFVHEAERESETNIWFVLDASASMLAAPDIGMPQQQHSSPQWNKFDYARHLIATLAYLALKQGDSVGFIGLSSANLQCLPANSGDQQWHALLQQLSNIKAGEKFPTKQLISNYINEVQKPGLVFFISDFFELNNEISDLLRYVGQGRSEVVALHMQSQEELLFPYKGAIRFEDLETNEQILISAANVKEEYLTAMHTRLNTIQKHLLQCAISYNSVDISHPLDHVLHNYLSLRAKGLR